MSVAELHPTMDESRKSDFALRVERAVRESGYSYRDLSYRMRVLAEEHRLLGVPTSSSAISAWARGTMPKRLALRLFAEAAVPEIPLDGETPAQRRKHVRQLREELEALWDEEDDRRRRDGPPRA